MTKSICNTQTLTIRYNIEIYIDYTMAMSWILGHKLYINASVLLLCAVKHNEYKYCSNMVAFVPVTENALDKKSALTLYATAAVLGLLTIVGGGSPADCHRRRQ